MTAEGPAIHTGDRTVSAPAWALSRVGSVRRQRRYNVLSARFEGNSIRTTCRMTAVAKGTAIELPADLRAACAEYKNRTLRVCPPAASGATRFWPLPTPTDGRPGRQARHVQLRQRADVDCHLSDTKLVPSLAGAKRYAGCAHEL